MTSAQIFISRDKMQRRGGWVHRVSLPALRGKKKAAGSSATGLMSNNKEDLGGETSGCGGAMDGEQMKAAI